MLALKKNNSIKSFFNLLVENKTYSLAFVCIVALFLRIIFLALYDSPLTADAKIYDSMAVNLLNGEGYTYQGKPWGHSPPLYSLFLSVIYYFAGHNIFLAKIANSFLGVLLCLLCYKFFRYFMSHKSSLFATALVAIDPVFIRISGHLLSENLVVPVFILWLILLLFISNNFTDSISDKKKILISFLSGFVFGCLLLIKGISICYFPLLPIIFFIHLSKCSISLKKRALYFVISGIGISIILAPWVVRNHEVYGKLVPISTSAGLTLYSSYKIGIYGNITKDKIVNKAKKDLNDAEASSFLVAHTMEYIWNNPGILPELIIKKIGYFFMPLDWGIMSVDGHSRYPGYNYIYAFLFPFFLFGIVKLFFVYKMKLFEVNWSIVLFSVLFLFLICLLFLGTPRFRMQIEPLIILIACYGLISLKTYPFVIYRKTTTYSFISAYFLLNFLFYLFAKPINIYVKHLSRSFLA